MEVNLIAFCRVRVLCIIYVHVHSFPLFGMNDLLREGKRRITVVFGLW